MVAARAVPALFMVNAEWSFCGIVFNSFFSSCWLEGPTNEDVLNSRVEVECGECLYNVFNFIQQ